MILTPNNIFFLIRNSKQSLFNCENKNSSKSSVKNAAPHNIYKKLHRAQNSIVYILKKAIF